MPSSLVRTLPALLAVTLASTQALHAQGPEKGNYSVGILLFTAQTGTVANFGRQWTDRLFIGVELDLREATAHQEPSDIALGVETRVANSDFGIGPVFKLYGKAVGPVVPFVRLRGRIAWGDQVLEQAGQEQWREDTSELAASLGIGGEWFPMRQISISGYTGLQTSRTKLERVYPSGQSAKQTTVNSGTFRSGVSITFYFR